MKSEFVKMGFRKREFTPEDLSEKAFAVYSNSDFEFYEKEGCLCWSVNGSAAGLFALEGGMDEVEEFLLSFAENEEGEN